MSWVFPYFLFLATNVAWALFYFALRKRALRVAEQLIQIREVHATMVQQLDEILLWAKAGLAGRRSPGASPLPGNLPQRGRLSR